MLKIINKEFFGFDVNTVPIPLTETKISEINEPCMKSYLLNVMIAPHFFDLKQYKKDPFASIIYNGGINLTPDYIIDELLHTNTYQFSMYEDDAYDNLLAPHKEQCNELRSHTILHYVSSFDDGDDTYNYIAIAAIPIKGFVMPVKRCDQYKLFNGAFISCKAFSWNNEYYNKIMYFLVDIRSGFSFQEYINTDDSDYGIMNDYRLVINADKDIEMISTKSIVPYKDREEFFSNPKRSLFYLSDVPPDIISRSNSLSVKMN